MYCLFLHFLSRAYPASQSLQRAKGVFTPFPQPVQGNVPPPLASRALCALQCSPRQLFPHTSTVPNSSQGQVFVPFIVMLWYTLSIWVPLNVASMCVLAWPALRRPPGQPPAPALETPHQPRAAGPPRNPRQPPERYDHPPAPHTTPPTHPPGPAPLRGAGGRGGHPTRHPPGALNQAFPRTPHPTPPPQPSRPPPAPLRTMSSLAHHRDDPRQPPTRRPPRRPPGPFDKRLGGPMGLGGLPRSMCPSTPIVSTTEVTDRISWLDQLSLQDTMASTAVVKTTLSETLNSDFSSFKFFTVKQIFPREPYRLKIHRDALYVPMPPGDHGFSYNKAPS